MMNGELQSEEALILKREIHSLGTTLLRGVQEVKESVSEELANQAEQSGKLLHEIVECRRELREVRKVLGLDVPIIPRPDPLPRRRHAVVPTSERPSIPPQFEAESGIVVTDTGSYRIEPGTLDRISKRISDIEDQKKLAEAEAAGAEKLRKELAAKNEVLSGRVKFVIILAGAFVASITTVVGLIEWSFRHVH
jgi:hypothetical protein